MDWQLLYVILYVAAALCFLAATFGVPAKISLVALGLLLWVLVPLIQTAR